MPMCHANSLYFFVSLLSIGATSTIFSVRSFDPVHCLETISQIGISFTSLDTNALHDAARYTGGYPSVGGSFKSSETHDFFRDGSGGNKKSSHADVPKFRSFSSCMGRRKRLVTMLHPEEQFDHLGTVGREVIGSAAIKLLDDMGNEVPMEHPESSTRARRITTAGIGTFPKNPRSLQRRLPECGRYRGSR